MRRLFPCFGHGSSARSNRQRPVSASWSATPPTCARCSSRSAPARRSCAAPTGRPFARSRTPSRRATRIPASMPSASPPTGWSSPAPSGISLEESPQIEFGFLLHDIGKVAVPDAILFKTSRLTDEEYALIAQHPVVGAEILRDVDFLGEGKLVVRHHHERWDGTGYPDGLAGDEIPLAARVFSVADTLDALTTDRPYRPASDWSARARGDPRASPARSSIPRSSPRSTRSRTRSSSASERGRCDADDPDRRRRSDDPQADRDHARGHLGLPAAGGGRRARGGRARGRPRGRRSSSWTSTCRA